MLQQLFLLLQPRWVHNDRSPQARFTGVSVHMGKHNLLPGRCFLLGWRTCIMPAESDLVFLGVEVVSSRVDLIQSWQSHTSFINTVLIHQHHSARLTPSYQHTWLSLDRTCPKHHPHTNTTARQQTKTLQQHEVHVLHAHGHRAFRTRRPAGLVYSEG